MAMFYQGETSEGKRFFVSRVPGSDDFELELVGKNGVEFDAIIPADIARGIVKYIRTQIPE